MNVVYYVKLEGQVFGPYLLEQIRALELLPDIEVFSTLTQEWKSASEYGELGDTLQSVEGAVEAFDLYAASYYLSLNGEKYGPLSLSDLSFLEIVPSSVLSIDEMRSWRNAESIPGLIELLAQLSQNAGNDSNNTQPPIPPVPPRPIQNPDENFLQDVIDDQEADIASLKRQLSDLQDKMNESDEAPSNLPIFDLNNDVATRYSRLKEELLASIAFKLSLPKSEDTLYKKVFPSQEIEKRYYVDEYRRFISSLIALISEIDEKTREAKKMYDYDMILLNNNDQLAISKSISALQREERDLINHVNEQINELQQSGAGSEVTIASLQQYLTMQRTEIQQKHSRTKTEELDRIARKKQELKQAFNDLRVEVLTALKTAYRQAQEYYTSYFDSLYETSRSTLALWDAIKDRGMLPPSIVKIGSMAHDCSIMEEPFCITEECFVEFLNCKNLIIRHNNQTKQRALELVNSLLGRLLAASTPGKVQLAMIDADEMDGTNDLFKSLNRSLFQILVRADEIRKYLDGVERHIGNIIKNLLLGPIKSLSEYNQHKENKEPYHVIVFEDFPIGVNTESLFLMQKILKNGIRAGVNTILLLNEDKINSTEESRKAYANCHIEQLEPLFTIYDLTKAEVYDRVKIENFTDEQLRHIVHYVNSGVEVREEEVIPFADYLLDKSQWWSRRSARYIEVPFGISEDRQIQSLKITQESGQNSAVVIGIPGSGKSVFLHALICNAAVNYSPDELNMYLIDFSGVEFNTYASHKLPHARVIAPEAEREFGMSILNELVEEGARRMTLCREYEVSNIVDLKAKNPSLHVPRLLVIIDEFQKIFEIDNDLISREANKRIHTIIQEYRKFGINLILATQKLPSSGVLPKDLIANRVVFKSSPADFSNLISWPSNTKVPELHTGECVYNSESGSPYANNKTRGFLVTKSDMDNLLNQISDYEQEQNYMPKHEMLVFRGNDLPEFVDRRMRSIHRIPKDTPNEVGIYLGESISIHETDICAVLRKESANNLLIMGGEPHVAQRIAYYSTLSLSTAHTDHSARFVVMNFMRNEDPINEEVQANIEALPFEVQFPTKIAEVTETLTAIKEEIDARRNDEELSQQHIYLSIFAFQLGRMFDRGIEARRIDDVSKCGLLLEYILRYGPMVGVFTIMQCDNIENMARIGNVLSCFSYRVAMQMTENDSNKVMGTMIANKLFIENRPSSVFRAYFRDNNRNVNIKFKPYK